jgi:hypothetical protein
MLPVMLSPAFAKLPTNPLAIGSDAENTIGILLVSACSAAVNLDQLVREQSHALHAAGTLAIVDVDVATIDPAQLIQPIAECSVVSLYFPIRFGQSI